MDLQARTHVQIAHSLYPAIHVQLGVIIEAIQCLQGESSPCCDRLDSCRVAHQSSKTMQLCNIGAVAWSNPPTNQGFRRFSEDTSSDLDPKPTELIEIGIHWTPRNSMSALPLRWGLALPSTWRVVHPQVSLELS